MNRDFTFGPDRTICLGTSGDREYRIIVTREAISGLEVYFATSPVGSRCRRPTRKGSLCQNRVAEAGLACRRHRDTDAL